MNKFVRILLLCLMLVAVIPAAAQDGVFGLSAEDVALLGQANTLSTNTGQFTFDYSVALTVDGAPVPVDITLGGVGVLDAVNEQLSITINGTAMAGPEATPLDAELRITGDNLYARATNPATGEDSGWFSLSLTDLQTSSIDMDSLGAQLGDAFAGGFAEGAGVNQADLDPEAFLGVLMSAATINPEEFISLSRGADEGNLASFTVDISLSDLANAEGMDVVAREFLNASGIAPGAGDAEIAAFNAILSTMLGDTTISLEQIIDLNTNLVNKGSIFLFSTIDPTDMGETGSPVSVVFSLEISLSNYDQPASVATPESAFEIPVSVLEDALGTTGGAEVDSGVGTTGVTSAGGALTVGSPIVVDLPAGGTLDFKLSSNETVNVTARSLTGGVDPRVAVLDGSGNELAFNDDHGTSDATLGFLDSVIENVTIPGSAMIRLENISFETPGQVELSVMVAGSAATGGDKLVSQSLTCASRADEFPGDVGMTLNGTCPSNCITEGSSVWGSDVYTDDSSICTAAIHAGVITDAGGAVSLTIAPGQDAYAGSERNGVSTSEWGSWSRSFTFGGAATPSTSGDAAPIAATSALPNAYAFPNGVSFSYPDGYTIQSEANIVTILMSDGGRSFIQVYEMKGIFGDTDMGLDFFKSTYGDQAASTWNFDFSASDFVETDINGRSFSVLQFNGTQNGEPVTGAVIIVPYSSGGHSYVLSYGLPPVADTFIQDTVSVAASLDG